MEQVVLNVLAAPRLVPMNSCSCTKGIAKGLQIVTASVPGLLPTLLAFKIPSDTVTSDAPKAVPARKLSSASSSSPHLHPQPQPSAEPPSLPVPDLELASLGEVPAREQAYIAMLSAMQR